MSNKVKVGLVVQVLEFIENDPTGAGKLQEFLNQQERDPKLGERRDFHESGKSNQ